VVLFRRATLEIMSPSGSSCSHSSNNEKNQKKQPTTSTGGGVHVVVQRYRWCRLLLNDTEWCTVGGDRDSSSSNRRLNDTRTSNTTKHCGLLVYTSFAHGTTIATLQKAALTLVQMPLMTWGHWQERSGGGTATPTSENGNGRPLSLLTMMQLQQEEQQSNDH
jgi:hypothetical protein